MNTSLADDVLGWGLVVGTLAGAVVWARSLRARIEQPIEEES